MTYKVIQWSTGYTGTFSLKYILNNPGLELVGVKCFSAEKEGVDAGAIAGMDPVGVKATQDTAALLAMDADCVIYMPGDPALADASDEGSFSQDLFKGILMARQDNCASTSWSARAGKAIAPSSPQASSPAFSATCCPCVLPAPAPRSIRSARMKSLTTRNTTS